MQLDKTSAAATGGSSQLTTLARACRDRGDWDEVLATIIRSVVAASVAGGPPRPGDTALALTRQARATFDAAVRRTLDDVSFRRPHLVDISSSRRIRAAVADWSRAGVPLAATTRVVGAAVDAAAEAATRGCDDTAVLIATMSSIVAVRRSLLADASAIFAEASAQEQAAPDRSPREQFVAAAIRGDVDVRRAADLGLPVSDRWQVLSISVLDAEVGAGPASITVSRGVTDVLGPSALTILSEAGGTVALPVTGDRDLLDTSVTDALTRAVGSPLLCTTVVGDAEALPELVARADELLDLARSIDREPGLYSMEDLVIEYQITRPGPARDALAALIAPLTSHADLLQTLRVHMSCGMNRRETARRLEVHPNTVDNRMSRVAAAIGLDLSQPRAITQARSAILAYDAVAARG